jgi:hypothetical protein
MSYLKLLLVLSVLLFFTVPACAHHSLGKVNVEIVPDTGGLFRTIPFKKYFSGQTHIIKKYLEARIGENYSIVVRNTTAERIGVVIAVDGRNIISGRKSYLKNNEMMYILMPYDYVKLEGWRTDNDTVHKFYFTDVKDSYSVMTFGDKSAMGLIIVAVFREKDRPVISYDKTLREDSTAPSSEASAGGTLKRYSNESAGTGFGDTKYSPVVKVEFDPESKPIEKIFVKYELRDVLCKKGLLKCWQEEENRLWDEYSYAPFPPGYSDRY